MSPVAGLVTPEQVKAAHAAGLEVLPWTANTPQEWERLANAGVDGIISDDPAALRLQMHALSRNAPDTQNLRAKQHVNSLVSK